MTESSTDPLTTREYTITRSFGVPREQVFKAWTEPARLARWFGPHGFSTPEDRISLDVRPGGAWKACVVAEDGKEAWLDGVYREVAEPEQLVFTTGDPDNTEGEPASVVTVTFGDLGDGSEMWFRQAAVNTDEAHAEAARIGWTQYFDRLAAYLAEVAKTG
jgi:uncharacterized protein YndB with AHSA1/START domain